MKRMKKFLAVVMAAALTFGLCETPAFAADDFVLDDAEGKGAASMIKTIKPNGQGKYNYNGWVTLAGADASLKYLEITYTGDISTLRIEVQKTTDTSSTLGKFWFEAGHEDKATNNHDFVSADGKAFVLQASDPTTVTVDLAASGIRLADCVESGGMHLHYGGTDDAPLKAGTTAEIIDAKLTNGAFEEAPAEGTVLTTEDGNQYKVTRAGYTVSLYRAAKGAVTVKVPETITVDDITYNVTSIAANACKASQTLQKVVVGRNITSIGKGAFKNCTKLGSVSISAGVTAIGNEAFRGCTSLTTVKISSGVKTIGTAAFMGCSKLKTVTLGKNVTTIGTSAFKNCTALAKITIPNKVTSIGNSAFYGCKKLTAVTIRSGVKKIGNEAFRGCTKLKNITIKSAKLTKVGKNALKGIPASAKIKVPSKKLSAYQKLLKGKGQRRTVKIRK